jgi:hypothetical protein
LIRGDEEGEGHLELGGAGQEECFYQGPCRLQKIVLNDNTKDQEEASWPIKFFKVMAKRTRKCM